MQLSIDEIDPAKIFDFMPIPMLLVDEDVRVVAYNRAAVALVGPDRSRVLRARGGDVLHCVHRLDDPDGCGRGPVCETCPIRTCAGAALAGNRVDRLRFAAELVVDGKPSNVMLRLTAAPFVVAGTRFALLVIEDITELMTLKRLIPICAVCKQIRDDQRYWSSVEEYFGSQLGLDFAQGVCPECRSKRTP